MAIDTITTTKTDTSVREGQKIVVNSQSNTVTIGSVVTDVTLQPYIANRIVSFYAYNMRPNTRVHAFFDSVLVDDYCAPGVSPEIIETTANWSSVDKKLDIGEPLVTDQYGQVAGQFFIPAGKFKTGDRVFELADTDNIARGSDSLTTKSAATFTASNISVTKETITLTTVNPEISVVPVKNTVVTSNTSVAIVIRPDIGTVVGSFQEPIAQGLTINTPSGEAGIFATSLDIYFKQKAKVIENGVTIYLCETLNGYPNGSKILPFSTVHLPYADINVGTDTAQTHTRFTFESPVFLANGVEYAFVVKPDGGDPDYWVYSANLGDIDLESGRQVFSQPVMGTAFYGATDTEWTALQTEYIKFRLNRAKFSEQSGDAYFNNINTDFLNIYNVAYSTTSAGILPGDYVFQSTNSTVATANVSIKGVVQFYNDVKGILYVANSTGNFTDNSFMQVHRFANTSSVTSPGPNTSTIIAWANTGPLYDTKINAYVPQFASITPAGTSLSFNYSGTSNTYVVDSNEYPVTPGNEAEFYDQERIVASHSNEVGSMGGAKSMTVRAHMTTDSELVSPLIDTVRHQQLLIANDIDPISFIYEEFFNSGSSKSKYVSRPITLAPGQDAEDIQVIMTAFRPYGSEIQVWVKFLNGEDSEPMDNKTWTPLVYNGGSAYSDPNNPYDMKELTFSVPQYYGMIPTNGTVTSTSSCTAVTGVSTYFTTDLKVGWYVNMLANSSFNETTRRIVNIASNTAMTLDQPFTGNHTAEPIFAVTPPTTAWLSANSVISLSGSVTVSSTNNVVTGFSSAVTANTVGVNNSADAILISNANTVYKVGNKIYYYVPASNTAIPGLTGNSSYYIATSNTTAITLNPQFGNTSPVAITPGTTSPGEVHYISSTNFLAEILPGSIIQVGSDSQRVVSISNTNSLTTQTPWSTTTSNASISLVSPNGVTYLNSTFTQYSTFKRFQIKIILQADNSALIPIIDDVRALALQL